MNSFHNEALFVTLAEILAEKQRSAENITKYIQLVCESFTFDCGCVYEADQDGNFCLKEQYSFKEYPFQSHFTLDAIAPQLRQDLAETLLLCLDKSQAKASHEQNLLQFFGAQSLILAPVVDEEFRIYGFIIFLNVRVANPILPEAMPSLQFIVNIIERQISVRVYRNKLGFAQHSLENILDNAGVDIYVNDFYTHEILYANASMVAPYGGKKKFIGNKCWEMLFPGQQGPCEFCPQTKLIDEAGNPTRVYSWNYQRPFDGAWFRVFSSSFRWIDGRLAHVVSSADITENKQKEAIIHYMANYDALTELPNRRMLVSEYRRRITATRSGDRSYLLFFDIDGFKAVNDNFGHDAGDEFLIQLGKFFSSIPMLKDAIYRNGGDEFVALIGDNVTADHIRNLANFIHERFTKPWELKTGPIFCNTSIGVACFPEDGLTAEELINKADQAMYQIKKSGGGRLGFFSGALP